MGAPEKEPPDPDPATAASPARSILLALALEDHFAHALRTGLAEAGWHVGLAHDAGTAVDFLGRRGAALIILDAELPDAQGILRHVKLDAALNPIPAIVLFPHGRSPLRPAALRVQGDLELTEPFDVGSLIAAAERRAARLAQGPPEPGLTARFILPGRQAELERVLQAIAGLLGTSGLDEAAQISFLAAAREAVGNAIQHGNRRDPAKSVRVEWRQTPEAVAIEVRDEGPGFDHAYHLGQARRKDAAEAARDRRREGGQGGLGLLMLVRCTDRVDYNETGNAVTLTKLIPAAP